MRPAVLLENQHEGRISTEDLVARLQAGGEPLEHKKKARYSATVLKAFAEYGVIELTFGQKTLVDKADLELLSAYNWVAVDTGRRGVYYAYAHDGEKSILMHRFLMGDPPGKEVDHFNGDTLDNRRQNLRACSHQQNAWNRAKPKTKKAPTSVYKGVSRTPVNKGKWRAAIRIGKAEKIHLGLFPTEKQAALAYNIAALSFHGEFAKTNVIFAKGDINASCLA